MIIGIDHGYGFIKTKNVIFGAGVAQFDAPPAIMERVVAYNGNYYSVGGTPDGLAGNKTDNDDYYILTLAAIAEELKLRAITVASITICAGLPLTRFGAEKKSFIEYLSKNKEVKFEYEGKEYQIRIKEVKVFPQGYSAIIPFLKGISCYVVDIGTGTTDIISVTSDNIPDMKNARTMQHGISTCIAAVNEQINREFGSEMLSNQIIDMIIGKDVVTNPKAKKICEKAISDFADSTLNLLRQVKVNYMLTPTYILGGGATLIEKYAHNLNLEDTCIKLIPDIKANAKGFELLAGK